jgi:hypothetical protein
MAEKTFEEKYNELLQEYDAKLSTPIPNWFISGVKTLLDRNITIEDWNRTYSYLEALVSDDAVLLKLLKLLKSEVSILETNKLDKSKIPSTLYAVGPSGLQEHIFYYHEPYPYSIPNRDADGQLKVPEEPTNDKHATSKKYVVEKVNKVDEKVNKVDETVANLNIQSGTGTHALIQKGEGQVASGEASVCFGSCGEGENRGAVGKYSAHFGLWNSATAERSIVGGGLSETTHEDSIVVGFGAKSSSNHCAVFGRCNAPNSMAYFQIGNGVNVENRKNAFEVLMDGRAKAYGVPNDNEDLTTKKYVDDKIANLETNKLDKTTTSNTLYGTDNLGGQTNFELDNGVMISGTIPKRDNAGQLVVPLSPSENKHATSRKYVDDKITESKNYTDTKIADLVDSAPKELDTLKELADAFTQNADVVKTLNDAIGNKANQLQVDNLEEAYNELNIKVDNIKPEVDTNAIFNELFSSSRVVKDNGESFDPDDNTIPTTKTVANMIGEKLGDIQTLLEAI